MAASHLREGGRNHGQAVIPLILSIGGHVPSVSLPSLFFLPLSALANRPRHTSCKKRQSRVVVQVSTAARRAGFLVRCCTDRHYRLSQSDPIRSSAGHSLASLALISTRRGKGCMALLPCGWSVRAWGGDNGMSNQRRTVSDGWMDGRWLTGSRDGVPTIDN